MVSWLARWVRRARLLLNRRTLRITTLVLTVLILASPLVARFTPTLVGFTYSWVALGLLLATLGIVYFPFIPSQARYMLDQFGQALILLLLYLLVWGQIGVSLGIPALIWNEDPLVRVSSSFGATLLLCLLGINSYYLGINPQVNDAGTVATRRTRRFMKRFGLNIPFGKFLEPKHPNGQMLSLHLRLSRLPFLLLLTLPTLFPAQFPYIPNEVPVHATNQWSRWLVDRLLPEGAVQGWMSKSIRDDFTGYLYALLVWAAGILAALLLIKVLLRIASRIAVRMAQRHPERQYTADQALAIYMSLILAVYVVLASLSYLGLLIPPGLAILAFLGIVTTLNIGYTLSLTRPVAIAVAVGWLACLVILILALLEDAQQAGSVALSLLVLSLVWAQIDSPAILPRLGRKWVRWASSGLVALSLGLAITTLALWSRPRGIATWALALVTLLLALAIARSPAAWAAKSDLAKHRRRAMVVLALLAWILLANHEDFKERFNLGSPVANDTYQKPVKLDEAIAKFYGYSPETRQASNHLLPSKQVLDAWKGRLDSLDPAKATSDAPAPKSSLPERPKLVIVCVSGGAIRAAYWTAVVLDRLQREFAAQLHPGRPDFHDHVRIITGASGGMVGTAYYVHRLAQRDRLASPSGLPDQWYNDIPRASLNPVARYMALGSPWRMLLPRLPGPLASDRGSVLEDDWHDLTTETFARLADGDPPASEGPERRGAIPSLIYSPMIVDDGRRLLISNLDLMTHERPTTPEAAEANWEVPLLRNNDLDNDNDASARRPISLSALELFKAIPAARGMSLATAARMSATFPFVSPAVNLPTEPPLRVVDAGYFDNYGVHLACAWALQNRVWIQQNTSGLVIIQVRDALSKRDRLGVPGTSKGFFEDAFQGLQFFTSVSDAVLRARFSTNAFRNDHEITVLSEVFQKMGLPDGFVATVIFENSARVEFSERSDRWPGLEVPSQDASVKGVAMNWYITRSELAALDRAIPDLAIHHKPGETYADLLRHAASQANRGTYRTYVENALPLVDRFLPRGPSLPPATPAQEAEELLDTDPAHLTERQCALLRLAHISWLNEKAAFGVPDPKTPESEREYYLHEFERAMNYERMVSLFHWWQTDFSPKQPD